MKIFKKGIMYVESEDILYVGVVPLKIAEILMDESLEPGTIIEFSGKDAVCFWKGKREILNYKYVKKHTDSQIREMINMWNDEVNRLSQKDYKNYKSFNKQRKKENSRMVKIKKLKYKIETFERYLKNRAFYDCKFAHLV